MNAPDNRWQDTTDGCPPLSPEGLARRRAMLGEVLVSMRRVRARRRHTRLVVAAASAVLLGVSAWMIASSNRREQPGTSGVLADIDHPDHRPAPPIVHMEHASFGIVTNDSSVVARMIVGNVGPTSSIDDDELLTLLADAGRPTGLIRTGGRVVLASDVKPRPGPDRNGSSVN